MIDWLTFLAPCAHAHAIDGGRVLSIAPGGEVEWMSRKRAMVRGSFDDRLTVRSATHTPEQLTHLEVSGNPTKFFQGHNLWGTDDLHALVIHTLEDLCGRPEFGLAPTPSDRAAWFAGDVRLTRVDETQSFHLSGRADVLSWIRSAEQTAVLPFRGRGQLSGGSTLYFGQHSRRWSLKLYAKGEEVRAKGHEQVIVLDSPEALAWADRTLRAELCLRSMELRRLNLDLVSGWSARAGVDCVVPARLLLDRLGAMTMTTTANLSAAVLEGLKPSLRLAYQSWESGVDLRAVLSRATFYRYRAELLAHGVDIVAVNPSERSNVVPLVRVLEAVPAGVPDWAYGSPLYWEPRRVA